MCQTAFGQSCMNQASVEMCGRSKEVNTPELIGQRVRDARIAPLYP